jgi:hypothetical protein
LLLLLLALLTSLTLHPFFKSQIRVERVNSLSPAAAAAAAAVAAHPPLLSLIGDFVLKL